MAVKQGQICQEEMRSPNVACEALTHMRQVTGDELVSRHSAATALPTTVPHVTWKSVTVNPHPCQLRQKILLFQMFEITG